MKVWDRAGIELATPRSAVRLASVARHVTNCATRPSKTAVLISNRAYRTRKNVPTVHLEEKS